MSFRIHSGTYLHIIQKFQQAFFFFNFGNLKTKSLKHPMSLNVGLFLDRDDGIPFDPMQFQPKYRMSNTETTKISDPIEAREPI